MSSFRRSCRLQNDDNLQAYLESFAHSDDPDIQQISGALQKTLEIYCMAEKGLASEPVRINYFKENFNRNFEAALETNPEPKVFHLTNYLLNYFLMNLIPTKYSLRVFAFTGLFFFYLGLTVASNGVGEANSLREYEIQNHAATNAKSETVQLSASGTDNETTLISEALIAEHTTYFDIQDNNIEGADTLLITLQQAHFVALGELHNRVRLGELTEFLLHYLEPHGFNHFAVETGPHSARKLQQLIRLGKPEVSAFYAAYSSRMYDIIPIPFIKGETDLRFLAAADSLGYELWGLDQEFYFSYAYLLDEMLHLGGDAITKEQRRLHRTLKRRIYRLDRRNQFRELFISSFRRSCRLQDDDNLQAYLESFAHSDDPDIQQISGALQKTLEIYCMAEKGLASEPVRINYFKENFNRNFEAALETNPEPKVFLKMGSFHMGRQRSPLNLYDIGNHVHQVAESKGLKSLHIYYLNRYFDGKDMKGRSGWEGSERFISVGDPEKWALIDLRPLREQLSNGTLRGTDFEVRTIRNYDFIIVAPEDDWVGRHW